MFLLVLDGTTQQMFQHADLENMIKEADRAMYRAKGNELIIESLLVIE